MKPTNYETTVSQLFPVTTSHAVGG